MPRPKVSWDKVAECAYRAYWAVRGGVNYIGERNLEYRSLPEEIKAAWQAAVRQAQIMLDGQPEGDIERHWGQWRPPTGNQVEW